MEKEIRKIVYNAALQLEACHFQGLLQPFPPHFHEYYVIGLVEAGRRQLSCKNQKYPISQGSLLLFCPGDTHGCMQAGNIPLDYRSLHIPPLVMGGFAQKISVSGPLHFSQNVLSDCRFAFRFRLLHEEILRGNGAESMEQFLLLLFALWQEYGRPSALPAPEYRQEVETACAFMEAHYAEPLSLGQICRHAGLSKSTLLRAFTKNRGITPYRYLETLRIGKAKKLLERGVPPAEAAVRTGFSDQSHFSRYFHRFIGLSPGAYREIFLLETKKHQKKRRGYNEYTKEKMRHDT